MLIPYAHAAQPASAPPGGGMAQLFIFIAIFVAFWFLMIRPQMKREKERQKMIEGVQRGDELVTVGGVLGKVASIDDQYLTLEIADKVEVQVLKSSVQAVLPKGTLKF